MAPDEAINWKEAPVMTICLALRATIIWRAATVMTISPAMLGTMFSSVARGLTA